MVAIFKSVSDVDLKRDSQVHFDKHVPQAGGLPALCPDSLIEVACASDDFNRANNLNIQAGQPAWGELWSSAGVGVHAALTIDTNMLLKQSAAGGLPNSAQAAAWSAFPSTTEDQLSEAVFVSAPAGGTQTSNFALAVRMRRKVAIQTWNGGLSSYLLYYQESWIGGLLNQAQMAIQKVTAGVGGATNPPVIIPKLTAGDVMKVTAANFMQGNTEYVCVKGYINNVLKTQYNDVDVSPAVPKLFTGWFGISALAFNAGSSVGQRWDNWRGCSCVPA